MAIEDLSVNLISQVGFPIFAFLLLYYYILKNQEDMQNVIAKNTEAINNLTLTLETNKK